MSRGAVAYRLAGIGFGAAVLAVLELLYLPGYLGSVPTPWGALIAAVTTPWLVVEAVSVHPRAAVVPLGVWLVVLFVVGTFGPGGDVLLPPDWRALVLLLAGIVPSLFVLGRVRPGAETRPGAQAGGQSRSPSGSQHG